jgi:hypothetical protein
MVDINAILDAKSIEVFVDNICIGSKDHAVRAKTVELDIDTIGGTTLFAELSLFTLRHELVQNSFLVENEKTHRSLQLEWAP